MSHVKHILNKTRENCLQQVTNLELLISEAQKMLDDYTDRVNDIKAQIHEIDETLGLLEGSNNESQNKKAKRKSGGPIIR